MQLAEELKEHHVIQSYMLTFITHQSRSEELETGFSSTGNGIPYSIDQQPWRFKIWGRTTLEMICKKLANTIGKYKQENIIDLSFQIQLKIAVLGPLLRHGVSAEIWKSTRFLLPEKQWGSWLIELWIFTEG